LKNEQKVSEALSLNP